MIAAGMAVLWAVVGLPACNAPEYKGTPIAEFMQMVEEEEQAAKATTKPALSLPARADAGPSEYLVGPSDVLNITVNGIDSLDAPTVLPVRVSEDGRITLPLVGDLAVGGLSLNQIEKAITAAYSPRFIKHPRVLAEVKEYHLTNVLVIGPSERPYAGYGGMQGLLLRENERAHSVALRRNERNVFVALSKASIGANGAGQLVYVQPAKAPTKLEFYDLGQAADMMRILNREPLEEGDIVIARPGAPRLVYIHGLISGGRSVWGGSGVYPIPETGLRLRQAIAMAGGPPTAFNVDKVVLARRFRDGQDVLVVFRWKNIVDGKEPDVELRPGDVVEIPHTSASRMDEIFQDVLRRAVVFQAGISAVYDPISQFVPTRVDVSDGHCNNVDVRNLILSDVALRGVRKVTSPVLGP